MLFSPLLRELNYGGGCSQAEHNPQLLNNSSIKILLGLCTGILPAIAAASATNSLELLELAPVIIRISFNLGLEVSRRSQNLDCSVGSWATVVADISSHQMHEILHQFHEAQVRNSWKRERLLQIAS